MGSRHFVPYFSPRVIAPSWGVRSTMRHISYLLFFILFQGSVHAESIWLNEQEVVNAHPIVDARKAYSNGEIYLIALVYMSGSEIPEFWGDPVQCSNKIKLKEMIISDGIGLDEYESTYLHYRHQMISKLYAKHFNIEILKMLEADGHIKLNWNQGQRECASNKLIKPVAIKSMARDVLKTHAPY